MLLILSIQYVILWSFLFFPLKSFEHFCSKDYISLFIVCWKKRRHQSYHCWNFCWEHFFAFFSLFALLFQQQKYVFLNYWFCFLCFFKIHIHKFYVLTNVYKMYYVEVLENKRMEILCWCSRIRKFWCFSSNLALSLFFCKSIVKTMKFIKTSKTLNVTLKQWERIKHSLALILCFFSTTLFNSPIQTIAKLWVNEDGNHGRKVQENSN